MHITDIIALAKAGYKMKDINTLIEQEKAEQPIPEISTEQQSTVVDDMSITPKAEESASAPTDADESVDYKSMYEQSIKALENVKSQLVEAQKNNSRQPLNTSENQASNAEILTDIVRSFM